MASYKVTCALTLLTLLTPGWSSGAGGVLQEIQTSVVDCEDTRRDSVCTEALTLEQEFSGGPLMCRQDGSWFLAGVLAVENKLTTRSLTVQGKSVNNYAQMYFR
ncbi:hypothetical protein Q5P01_003036 [Channa striata]|uniref:Uncharacterized protein n=1 Tax=Channa striata TaxID=64152 RepID=A0AA88NU91_CHASR|nr:hypothetical protein Q5P01_003036 [Channa striata]